MLRPARTSALALALLVAAHAAPCAATIGDGSPQRCTTQPPVVTQDRLAWDNRGRPRPPREGRREIVPNGGLRPHEGGAWAGHTLERHVGKSDAFLRERLGEARDQRGDIGATSTFENRRQAEHFVGATLKRNESAIWRWLKSGNSNVPEAFTARFSEPTGRRMERGEGRSEPVYGARVVLVRDSTSPSGYRIVSSFPVK